MTNLILYITWFILYGLCAALGCIAAPTGLLYGLCIVSALLFFLPPAILLHRAKKISDRKAPKRILFISLTWLAVSLIMIIANILSVGATAQAGKTLHYLLVVLTAPMVCGQSWVLSIFLWACLMAVSVQLLKKKK